MLDSKMRRFVYVISLLLREGKHEECSVVEEHFKKGIASYLYKEYTDRFDKCEFDPDSIEEIDDYCKTNYNSSVCGNEYRKYLCKKEDGLWLVLFLIMDNIHFPNNEDNGGKKSWRF